MLIYVVDLGLANLHSVQGALHRCTALLGTGDSLQIEVGADADRMSAAGALILPGVGAFGPAARRLAETGIGPAIGDAVKDGRPLLGICLGMQLLFEWSHEDGRHPGLGLIPGEVVELPATVKRPQMGWNRVHWAGETPELLTGIPNGNHFYFANSYAASAADPQNVQAWFSYGGDHPAVVRRKQVWGTQFHPEKSGDPGLRVWLRFLQTVSGSD